MAAFEKLGQLAGAALFAATGLALVQLLPALRGLPPGRRLAHAYLLGTAWIAGGLYLLSHAFAVPLRRPAILAVAAVPVVAALAARARLRSSPGITGAHRARWRSRWTGLQIAAVATAAVVFLGVLADVLINPLRDWDGRMTWAAQARYMRAEGTVDATVLTETGWYITHPWYPPLLPVAQVAVLELLQAGEDEHLFRGFYAFFFPVWLTILYGAARRWTRRGAAALTCLGASLLPLPAIFRGGGAVSAYSDLPLACFYGAGVLLLLRPRPRLSAGAAAGLLLGAAVLTKNEGGPLALWALAVAALAPLVPRRRAVARRRPGRWKPLVLAAAAVAAALALLLSWRAGIPERFESYRTIVAWDAFWPGVVTRIPLLLPKIRYEMISLADWGFFWSAALVVLAAGWRGLRRRSTLPLLMAAVGPLGVAWLAYAISLHPADIVRMSWNRFVLQGSIPLLALFAFALDDVLRRSRWLPPAFGGPPRSPKP